MRTATIKIQIDTSDAPLSEDDALDFLAEVTAILGDTVYVSSAMLD